MAGGGAMLRVAGVQDAWCAPLRRIDTTVIEADIDHPTDADLLEHGVRKLGRLVGRIKASRRAARSRVRSAGVLRCTT